MRAAKLERFLAPTLSQVGFRLEEVDDPVLYQNRTAWAIYYSGSDCKLQIAWSTRDGGNLAGWGEMTQEFLTGVQSVVEPILVELGFRLDEYLDNVDEGGPKAAVVFYRSDDCKIQIYDSTRGGEINCMIAPLGADNTFGPYDHSQKWQYLPRFALRQGVSAEEITKDKLPVDFPTTDQFLESVRNRIKKYYPIAHAGILEMGGPEWWTSRP